jgi:hypothetical protein
LILWIQKQPLWLHLAQNSMSINCNVVSSLLW